MNILAALADKKIINRDDISAIEAEVSSSGEGLEAILVKRGVSAGDVLDIKSKHLKVPTRKLDEKNVPFDVLKYVPEESARHYQFVPLRIEDNVLEIGVLDTDNIEALDALNFISSKVGLPYKIFLISEVDFNHVLEMYKNLSGEVHEALEELSTELLTDKERKKKKETSKNEEKEKGPQQKVIKEDAPVIKIVATILRYAVEGSASDIHIEPMNEHTRVRFRVDGILHTSLVLPSKIHDSVVARIKVLTSMRLDEKRKPQDGRFSATVGNHRIDFRVSTFPTFYGEKVVMRILDVQGGVRSLDEMGFSKHNLSLIRNAIKRPYGLILISGPTGSGKSTTLYSMLNEINRDERNVLSLEDPVEYSIEGMSQSQVFPEIGYTFASGLRTTLRQDPDIIMVGEIRDKETAKLAIQAALTGHLVLSTIHTNNAAGVIPRLIDMGVDPFLIAPTLILAIAQRLVRTLCPNGGKQVPIDGSLKIMIEKQFEDLPKEYRAEISEAKYIYKMQPTADCPNGTRGRTAVLEVLQMNDDIEHIILTNPVEEEIAKAARRNGMLTMKEDAIIKVFKRVIPFEEVNTLGGTLLVDEEGEHQLAEKTTTSI